MITFVKQSQQQAKEVLINKFNKQDYDYANCDFIDDFARISSLLTDEQAVLPYLKRLNDRLMVVAAMDNFQAKNVKGKSSITGNHPSVEHFPHRKVLGTTDAHENQGELQVVYQKHHKVLSTLLNQYLSAQGFNSGVGSVVSKGQKVKYSDGQAAKLPGFVQPEEFKSNLLKVGRHFKDPGVTLHHGEFTHQIHWFIVCEHSKEAKPAFNNKPIDIFKACGDSMWGGIKNNLCIWDLLFEGGLPSRDFRHAESLNNYLLLASAKDHKHNKSLWFLADLIMGRFAKRLWHKDQSLLR